MGIKKEKIEEPKAPRTIKIRTMVVVVIWLFSILAALITGWTMRSTDITRVNTEARVLLKDFIDTAKTNELK